jgi:hypothetical protein
MATEPCRVRWAERRRYERVTFFCPVTLVLGPGGVSAPGSSLDISLGGVRVVAGVSAERGRLLRVRFHLKVPGGDLVDEVDGRVANFSVDEHVNSFGIEFLEPLAQSVHPELFARIGRF